MSRSTEALRLRELALIAHIHANEGRTDEAKRVFSWSPELQSMETVITAPCPKHNISESESNIDNSRAILLESDMVCTMKDYSFVRRFSTKGEQ